MFGMLVVSLYTSRVLLSTLGVEDYGVYNVVGGIIVVLSVLNGGLSASTSRFLTFELGRGDQEILKKTFAASLNMHIIMSFIVLLIADTAGLWFFYHKMVIPENRIGAAFWVYQISIANAMITLTQVPYKASIIAHERMRDYAYISIIGNILNLVITFSLRFVPFDKLIVYAILYFAVSTSIALYYRFYCIRNFVECRFKLFFDPAHYARLLSYSGWDLFGQFSGVCQGQGLNILLNMFCGPLVNAAWGITNQVQMGINSFVNSFMLAIRPQIIKNYAAGKKDDMYWLMFYQVKYGFFLMLLIFVPIYFELHFVLSVWLREIPEYAPIFIKIILFACLVQVFISSHNAVMHAIGKIKISNTICGTLMILVLPISYILLKLNRPPQYVFIVLVIINAIATVIDAFIIRSYEYFSLLSYLKSVILPCAAVGLLSIIIPSVISLYMNESLKRALLNFFVADVGIIFLAFSIGTGKNDQKRIKDFLWKKLKNKTMC
jgi:Na+-driven multidrug efflux pump